MSPDQVATVQQTFTQVAEMGDATPRMFYSRLFAVAPSVRPLFPDDLSAQGRQLMASLSGAVARLSEDEPDDDGRSQRSASYGAEAEYYALVGDALLWTLAISLGDAFTTEVRGAWWRAYPALSGEMIALAYGDRSDEG